MIRRFLLLSLLFAARAIEYEILPRRSLNLVYQSVSPQLNPALPSFDGDLNKILQLALRKAALTFNPSVSPSRAARRSQSPSTTGIHAPTTAPTVISIAAASRTATPAASVQTTVGTSTPTVAAATLTKNKTFTTNSTSAPKLSCYNTSASTVPTGQEFTLTLTYRYSLETTWNSDRAVIASHAEIVLQDWLAPLLLSDCKNTSNGIVSMEAAPADVPSLQCKKHTGAW
jgi:hypothetical protein